MRYFAFAVIVSLANAFAGVTAFERLPRSAEAALRNGLHTTIVADIHEITYRRVGAFEYLGLLCQYSHSWVDTQRGRFVLRKRHGDRDWSRATLFAPDTDIPILFRLPPRQFRAEVERPLSDET